MDTNSSSKIKLDYIYYTDFDMQTRVIADMPTNMKLRHGIKHLYIQSYGEYDTTYDVILERDLSSMTMQGTYLRDLNRHCVITGMAILASRSTVRIHFKLSKNSRTMASAKKLYKSLFLNSIETV